MARVDNEFDWPPVRRGRYPWGEWLDGQTWRLKHKHDFNCKIESMRITVCTQARRLGRRARTAVDGDDLIIQAFGGDGQAAEGGDECE